MKTTALASLALVTSLACGGNGTNAALSRTFSYGSPQPATGAESSAATSAQASLSSAASFSATPSASSAAAVLGFAAVLSDAALGSSGFAMPRGGPSGALRQAADFSACTTVVGDTVTFTNCSDSSTGFAMNLNGSITASAGKVSWSIAGSFSGSQNGETFNIDIHEAGSFTITATQVTGSATYDIGGSISAQGASASFGLSAATIVDLTYQTSPGFCVTSGTVEVKRVWTAKPQGASGLADAGVKIAWSACNGPVTVAHSQ